MNDGGKGSARRPMAVSDQDYANRWDAIFGRDQQPERKTHHFVHNGWGKYHCQVCGKKEDDWGPGGTCPGKPLGAV